MPTKSNNQEKQGTCTYTIHLHREQGSFSNKHHAVLRLESNGHLTVLPERSDIPQADVNDPIRIGNPISNTIIGNPEGHLLKDIEYINRPIIRESSEYSELKVNHGYDYFDRYSIKPTGGIKEKEIYLPPVKDTCYIHYHHEAPEGFFARTWDGLKWLFSDKDIYSNKATDVRYDLTRLDNQHLDFSYTINGADPNYRADAFLEIKLEYGTN